MNKLLINKKLTNIKNTYDQCMKLKDMIYVLEDNQEIIVRYKSGVIAKYKKYQNKYKVEIDNLEIDYVYRYPEIKAVIHNMAIIEGNIIEEIIK